MDENEEKLELEIKTEPHLSKNEVSVVAPKRFGSM